MNYFSEYGNRELYFMKKFVSNTAWLSKLVSEVKRDNTSLHDLIIVTTSGHEYTVEVKEDEHRWYSKTRNIGLDYISAFHFKNFSDKKKWDRNWVPCKEIEEFEKVILVNKYGKLKTCDADFQFYFVWDKENNLFSFSRLYDNRKMKSNGMLKYLKGNYNLRINDKKSYGLDDTWESAAFFVNPLTDKMLQECEINNITDMEV